jgi:hypothetical protein
MFDDRAPKTANQNYISIHLKNGKPQFCPSKTDVIRMDQNAICDPF